LNKRLLSILLLSCSSFVNAGLFSSNCPEAKQSKQPNWVKSGYEYSQPGYNYGFGEARFDPKLSYDQQLKQAEQQAQQDLVSSIHLEVDASSGISTFVESDATGEKVKRHTEIRMETRSKLDLPGLPIHQQWQDADNCTVYVQVRIDKPMVVLVLRRTQAQAYFQDAQNDSKPIKLRIFAIDEAIRLAKSSEFGRIQGGPTSQQMLREFAHVSDDLLRIKSKSNHVFYIVNETQATDTESLVTLRSVMRSAMPGSFETGKQCSSPAICLHQAGKTAANYASVAVVRMDLSKQNGFWIGNFVVEMSLWDLADNSRLYSSGPLPARVMNRHQHKLTLNNALKKWGKLHKSTLNEYQQKAATLN